LPKDEYSFKLFPSWSISTIIPKGADGLGLADKDALPDTDGDTDGDKLILGDAEAEPLMLGDTDAEPEILGLTDAEPLILGLTEGDPLMLGETDAEPLMLGLTLGDSDKDADPDTDGDTEADLEMDGETLALLDIDGLALGEGDNDADPLTVPRLPPSQLSIQFIVVSPQQATPAYPLVMPLSVSAPPTAVSVDPFIIGVIVVPLASRRIVLPLVNIVVEFPNSVNDPATILP